MKKFTVLGACALAILGFSPSARAYVITFDAQGLTGPSLAASTTASPVTVSTPIGNVTLSGGAILTAETNLPADTSSLYYTSSFLSGGLNPITVQFPTNISNFFLNVYNGSSQASFTVADNMGTTSTVTLAANTSGGTSLVSFPAVGRTVTITENGTTAFNFSIDNIGFNEPTPGTTVPEPASIAVLGMGLVGLWRRRSQG